MACLRTFIADLDRAGELVRVSCPVSPLLEITEIADRLALSASPVPSTRAGQFDADRGSLGGPAVLF